MAQLYEAYAHHMNQHSPEGIYEPAEKKIIVRDSLFNLKIDDNLTEEEKVQGKRNIELTGYLPAMPAWLLLNGIEKLLPEGLSHPLIFHGLLDMEETFLEYTAKRDGPSRMMRDDGTFGQFMIGAMAMHSLIADLCDSDPKVVKSPIHQVYFAATVGEGYVNGISYIYKSNSLSRKPAFKGFFLKHGKQGTRAEIGSHVRGIDKAISDAEKTEDIVADARK